MDLHGDTSPIGRQSAPDSIQTEGIPSSNSPVLLVPAKPKALNASVLDRTLKRLWL